MRRATGVCVCVCVCVWAYQDSLDLSSSNWLACLLAWSETGTSIQAYQPTSDTQLRAHNALLHRYHVKGKLIITALLCKCVESYIVKSFARIYPGDAPISCQRRAVARRWRTLWPHPACSAQATCLQHARRYCWYVCLISCAHVCGPNSTRPRS
jgi:hypothetical protein